MSKSSASLINYQIGPNSYTTVQNAISNLSGRNRIINGACNVVQRGPLAVTSPSNGYGGPDRFFAANAVTGSQFTQSQGTITFGGVVKSAVVQTVNTAATVLTSGSYWGGINQPIEGFNCFDLLGQQAMISFIFSTNVTGTYSVALRDYTATNAFISTFAATAGVPIKVTIPVASIPTTLTTPNSAAGGMYLTIGSLNTGNYQSSTLNAWQAGNLFVANTATNWGATAGNFIAATEIQLEAGTVATPFERRSYGLELALCQRYFQAYVFANGQAFLAGLNTSTTDAYAFMSLMAPMRAAGSASSVGAGAFTFLTGLGTIGLNSLTATTTSVVFHFSTPSGLTTYQSGFAVPASGIAVLFVNSEL